MPVPLLKRRHFLALILAITIPGIAADLSAGPRSAWQPASPAMLTPWGEHVSPDNAWNDYPRPSLVRPSWQSLNGLWDFTVTKENSQAPVAQGKILVPFCIESSLSGVGRPLEPDEVLWYNRTFETASHARGRLLLHFGAADYEATVWVNDTLVGSHRGGNTPFSFDITEASHSGKNTVKVRIIDRTDAKGSYQLVGKQTLDPHGIKYTRVSGIWQTVWLEEVPETYVSALQVTTAIAPATITLAPTLAGTVSPGALLKVKVSLNGKAVATGTGPAPLSLAVADAQLWSPEHPTLYDLDVSLVSASGEILDSLKSYAGIREVGTLRDKDGNLRFTLNGKVIFHWGTLDQGWWPDGLLTPPSDEAMVSDIKFLKDAGFNMLRKHVKIEPLRYYYACDKLGILVWQDQPAGGLSGKDGRAVWTRMAPNPADAVWPDAAATQWKAEYKEMVDNLRFFPSIVVWVPFNEAWGQHSTLEIGGFAAAYDPTRPINIASGGNFWPVGAIADNHSYPSPGFPLEDGRFKDFVKVVGEFGGHGWAEPGHLWTMDASHLKHYGNMPKTREEWFTRYKDTLTQLAALKAKGIAAGVYTQTTDVEGEVNGLLTYDRRFQKADPTSLRQLSESLGEEIRR